jgi:hypothetical protein
MSNEEKFYIVITIDTNDADYITSFKSITKSKLDLIMPLINKIKEFKPYKGKTKSGLEFTHNHNYPFGTACREDLGEKSVKELYSIDENIIEEFEGLLPFCEYDFHSINSIKLFSYMQVIKLI